MDRPIMYVDQIPLVEQFLTGYREAQTALGWIAQGMLGPGPYVDALAVTQTSPPSMSVNIAPGQMFQIEDVDSTAYGNLDADVDHSVLKQFVSMDTVTETLVAPTTNGYAINYLIQVAASEVDADPELLPYYNSENPAQPFSGPPTNLNPPTSSGTEQMTRRACKVVINAKGGIPALSGQQTTPAPDAGYIGIYVVTVAQGATAIHSSDISIIASAPWVTPKLCEIPRDVQSGMWCFAGNASPSGAAFSATLNPIPAQLTPGMTIVARMTAQAIANNTLNVNGFGALPVVRRGGQACVGTEWLANDYVGFRWTGSSWQLLGLCPADIATQILGDGEGIHIASNTINLDFPDLQNDATPADVDLFALYQEATSHHRNITWAQLKTALGWTPFITHSVIYVRTDGDNANDGFSNTSSGALKDISAAYAKLASNLVPSGGVITIQLGNPGTYALPNIIPNNGLSTIILGNTTAQDSYIITGSSGGVGGGLCAVTGGGAFIFRGCKLQNTSSSYATVFVNGTNVQFDYVTMEMTTTNTVSHITAIQGGVGIFQNNCKFSGNTGSLCLASGAEIDFGSGVYTLIGSPTFSAALAIAADGGTIVAQTGSGGGSWVGSCSGIRCIARENAIINLFGAGSTWFPGTSAGQTVNGGYIV